MPIQARLNRCVPILPVGHDIAGVATDDVNDLVIWASSNFSGPNANNLIHIAPRANPCASVCTFQVPDCGGNRLGPIRGVAYDPCDRIIWVTDGKFANTGVQTLDAIVEQNTLQVGQDEGIWVVGKGTIVRHNTIAGASKQGIVVGNPNGVEASAGIVVLDNDVQGVDASVARIHLTPRTTGCRIVGKDALSSVLDEGADNLVVSA